MGLQEDKVAYANARKILLQDNVRDIKKQDQPLKNIAELKVKPEYQDHETQSGFAILEAAAATAGDDLSKGSRLYYSVITNYNFEGDVNTSNIVPIMVAFNNLGVISSKRCRFTESEQYLLRALEAYKQFTAKFPDQIPTDIGGLLAADGQGKESIEKDYTLTLYFLAQVYGNLGQYCRSARYCHETLRRQLALDPSERDPIEWSLNCATLAMVLINRHTLPQARHHLAAATYILDQHRKALAAKVCRDDEKEKWDADMETLERRYADVARCWITYCIHLLRASKDRLVDAADDDHPEKMARDKVEVEARTASEEEAAAELSTLSFDSLPISEYESQVSDKNLLTFDDARLVFLNAQTWVNKAKEYYTLENMASDHIAIVQDVSQLYKFLAFFEENEERQAKMHKKRIDSLEVIVKEVNPTYYMTPCRQIWYELGEVYSEILYIKLEKLQASEERPTAHALKKVNHLVSESIRNFQAFLNSLADPKTRIIPKKFTPDLLRPALMSYFHLGRLYMKYISMDKTVQLQNVENSLKNYTIVIDYCAADAEAAKVMVSELGACQGMADLLPAKICALKSDLRI